MFVLFNGFYDLSNTKRMSSSLSGFMWICYMSLFLTTFHGYVYCEIDYNTINDDGSFSFRHKNDDIGSYYHSASGSPDNIVRGRYGSRNPATGQVEEVVYTAGPRGFRANGPKIHRKMDLSQYPPRPIGSPDDPLADPYDDPSYSFSFRTSDHSRSENSDSTGRIRGLYSYLDDVGERHTVRYAAGAGTGYEVSNAVPDNPASVAYSAPLYKAHPKTRGKMSVQRGPNGSYKLIAAGPDHRRAESRSPDGLVRGTYSYLDDKGVQRTVEYVAGAGIGYRVVHNQIGPGTHINPSVSDFRLSDTDFKLSNEYGRSGGDSFRGDSDGGADSGRGEEGDGEYLHTSGTGRTRSKTNDKDSKDDSTNNAADGAESGSGRRGGGGRTNDREGGRNKSDRMGTAAGSRGGTRYRGEGNGGGANGNRRINDNEDYTPDSSRDSPKIGGRGGNRPTSNRNSVNTDEPTRNRQRDRNRDSSRVGSGIRGGGGNGNGGTRRGGTGGSSSNRDGYDYNTPSTSSNNYNFKDDDVGSLPPLVTPNRKVLEIERERDWVQRHHDSTIIKNVGKWYIGLPPGQSVRAHVQNIDVLPLGGRHVLSPSEALRQDEIADMAVSLETETSHSS